MRVLQLIETLAPGGAEHALVDLVAGLATRAEVVDVAVLSPPTTLATQLAQLGAKTISLGAERRWEPRIVPRLRRCVREYDLLHAHLFMPELYAGFASGVPRVVSLHNLGYDEDPPVTVAQHARKTVHRHVLARTVDAWIAVSAAVAESYARHLGLEGIEVIGNAFALPASAPGPAWNRAAFRALHGVGDVTLIVSVGRLTRQKAHVDLIRAVAACRQPIELVIIGDGPLRSGLEEEAARLPTGRVRLLGALPRDETLRWIAAGEIFALPSVHEAFGVVLLEAMALGRPVIATRTGGVPGLVREGQTALLATPGRSGELGEALDRLISDPAMQVAFGERGRIEVAARFGRSAVAGKVYGVYERVLRAR